MCVLKGEEKLRSTTSTLVTSARYNGCGGPRAPQDRSEVRKTTSASKFSLSRRVAGRGEGPEGGEHPSLSVSRQLSNCWLHHLTVWDPEHVI